MAAKESVRMQRSTFTGQVLVYKYGCPSWAKLNDASEQQLRLAHELRNELVAIHRSHSEAVAAIWSEHPEVAASEAVLERASLAVEAAVVAAKDERQRNRTKEVCPETRKAISDAKAAYKAAKADHKAAKDAAYDILSPRFVAANAEQRAQKKGTYAEFVQRRGLFWPTYNDVVAHFEATTAAVIAKRKAGQPADVRFHRWTGEGTLTVQLQREAGDPVRSPTRLASDDSKWRNSVRLPLVDPEEWDSLTRAEQRVRSRSTVAIRIGSEGARNPVWCELPVVWHRPLPADADVTQVQVTKRLISGKARLSVAVTVRTASAQPSDRSGMVAINLGWRSLGEDGVRVAVWDATSAPSQPIAVPSHLSEVIRVATGGQKGEVVIPRSWQEAFGRCDSLRSRRDSTLDLLRPKLVEWLRDHPDAATALSAEASDVIRWRSANRFAALASRWRNERQDDDDQIYQDIEAWRVHDKHLWSWEANQRDQLVARRTDTYRVLGSLLASAFGCIVVDDSNLAQLARVPATEDPDSEQATRARSQRVLVSPGILRSSVVAAAKRRGVAVESVAAKNVTTIHSACGTNLTDRVDFAERVTVWCPTCEKAFDQDYNAAANLLNRVTGEAA